MGVAYFLSHMVTLIFLLLNPSFSYADSAIETVTSVEFSIRNNNTLVVETTHAKYFIHFKDHERAEIAKSFIENSKEDHFDFKKNNLAPDRLSDEITVIKGTQITTLDIEIERLRKKDQSMLNEILLSFNLFLTEGTFHPKAVTEHSKKSYQTAVKTISLEEKNVKAF